MAVETSGFFNAEYDASTDYWDRVYTADQFASYFAQLIGNGVFEGDLQVKQYSDETANMLVRVTIGKAMINGYWYSLDEETYFVVDVNVASNVRIDCICLQYNFSNRSIKLVYHKNTNQPTRNGEMYELMLCTINVLSNATSITQSSINDTRYNSTYCGIVTGLIDQINFDEEYIQFTTWFNEIVANFNAWIENYKITKTLDFNKWTNDMKSAWMSWESSQQADFINWFNNLRYVLDGDVAGHLQNEIDQLDEGIHIELNVIRKQHDGFEDSDTVFDGNVTTQTYDDRIVETTFNDDGSITEILKNQNGVPQRRKVITFNEDGSILENVDILV